MSQFDLPLAQLQAYRPDLPVPEDLDEFWKTTLAEARGYDLAPRFELVDTGFTLVHTYDVRFSGYGGHQIRAWLRLPALRDGGPLPTVVQFHGYNGGRGLPNDPHLWWPLAGYAQLSVDTRGQGSGWQVGDTPDPEPGANPEHAGFMTRGVLDPHTYFYRRVFTDAVRAVEVACGHPDLDPTRVAVTGASQGGGISLAVASLVPDLHAVLPDVPFLSAFPRALTFADSDPYGELVRYLRVQRHRQEEVLRTLAYFDVAVLSRRAQAPALFSVALMDRTCPPSTVYAAYNNYGGPKEIAVYPYNDHEGGQVHHDAAKLAWLRRVMPVRG